MTDLREPSSMRDDRSGRFVVDGSYLRQQASEAIVTFLAPLQGVYAAATGKKAVGMRGRGKGRGRGRASE